MLDRIKGALPCSLSFSIVFTLIGIPLGHYHVGRMAPEMLLSFVAALIVYMAINMFYSWIIEKADIKKR